MPSTRARSAAVRNGPALSRKATILAALRRPIPEIRSRSATEPRLITSVVTGSAGAGVRGASEPTWCQRGRAGARRRREGKIRCHPPELGGADPLDPAERRGVPEGTPAGPLFDDAPGQPGTHPRQPLELLRRRPVNVDALAPAPPAAQGAPDCRVVRAPPRSSRNRQGEPRPVGGASPIPPCG